jgi:CRP-like cAMP-binding protein
MENTWVILYDAIKAGNWEKAQESGRILIDNYIGADEVHPLFEELLNPDVLKRFKDIELIRCKPKTVIMREGEYGDEMFIVINGQVEITTARPKAKAPLLPMPPVLINYYVTNLIAGKKLTLAKLGAGTILGEIALISSKPRSSTVTSVNNTELISISKAIFDNIIKQKPQIKVLFTDLYISRLERTADGLKNAGKSVNSCVCNLVVDKIKGAKINSCNSNVKAVERPGIEDYLRDIEVQYKNGDTAEAVVSYLKLGSIFAASFIKNIVPTPDFIVPFINQVKTKVPILGNIIERLPINQSEILSRSETASDDFLALFNKHIVQILDKNSLRHFNDKEVVFKEGDKSDEVYVVKEGSAKAYVNRNKVIAEFSEGSVFGEFAFVTENPRTATIKASGVLTVYELKRPILVDILQKHPEILTQFNSIYQSHVDELIERINVTKEEFKKLIYVNA